MHGGNGSGSAPAPAATAVALAVATASQVGELAMVVEPAVAAESIGDISALAPAAAAGLSSLPTNGSPSGLDPSALEDKRGAPLTSSTGSASAGAFAEASTATALRTEGPADSVSPSPPARADSSGSVMGDSVGGDIRVDEGGKPMGVGGGGAVGAVASGGAGAGAGFAADASLTRHSSGHLVQSVGGVASACEGKRCPQGYEMLDRGDRCSCRPSSTPS